MSLDLGACLLLPVCMAQGHHIPHAPRHAESNTWRNVNIVGDRPGVRASAACCVFGDDKMLVFGGYDGREFLDDLWILHTGEACALLQ